MRRIALIFTILISITEAKEVKLTPEQSRNWHIETKKPVVSDSLVVGKFMAEVVTPPQLLQTVSLPFEAQINKRIILVGQNFWIKLVNKEGGEAPLGLEGLPG